ncbi:MAG: pdz domain (also known as dhr or glgf) protein [Myxococcales bacterium]|nr:pdz domain (also known as dhr or glgf) protein [Myxococcales bacterium]
MFPIVTATSPLPRRAYLGAELPPDEEAFTAKGLRVAGVVAGGMADLAGVEPGDTIVAIAGLPVRTLCELGEALRRAGAGDTTAIVLERGVSRTVRVIPQRCEPNAIYGELAVAGARLRTIATRLEQPRGAILVIQGIACESIDHATAPDAPLAGLIAGWASAGFETWRFDKRGVGDSEGGPCDTADFSTELSDAQAALSFALAHAQKRSLPLYVFGHSVGGIVAALLGSNGLAGIMVYGSPVERWLACLLDSVRRQLALRAASESEIVRATNAVERLARDGELNGRSAAYHAQLDQIDIAAAWRTIDVPVLVLRGEHDWVVRPDDQARVATLARGATSIVDLPGLDHLFGAHPDREASLRDYGIGVFDLSIVTATVGWLDSIR